jgi:GTP-binding protein
MKIQTAVFETSAPELDDCPEALMPEFAFIGRSNVGKSSFINMLTSKKDLAKVSATPGHTKLINFFIINRKWRLVDLPGYGYAKVQKEQRDFFHDVIANYIAYREGLTCVFVIIDGSITPQRIDLEFVHWLMQRSLPFALIFNKIDKEKPIKVQANIAAFEAEMAQWSNYKAKIFTASAKNGKGAGNIIDYINRQ